MVFFNHVVSLNYLLIGMNHAVYGGLIQSKYT